MSEEAAFLAAIWAGPEDDTPRLVYADWLDEQGGASNEARAEYIRLEIQNARDIAEKGWASENKPARDRARKLFVKYADVWFPELFSRKNILRGTGGSPDMRRGFPYRLLARAAPLLNIGERLMQLAPLTEVEFRDMTNSIVERFVKAPWVRGIRELNLSGFDIPPTDWSPLADCLYLTETVELAPYGGTIPATGAARIAAANPFPKLQCLSLGAKVTDTALAQLFGGIAFTGLRTLKLSSQRSSFGLKGIEAIAASKALAGLKGFDLPWHPIRNVLPALTKARFWSGLESLEMLRCGLTDKDVALLVRNPPPLRVLDLDDNKLTAKSALLIAESPLLATLTDLDLSRSKIGDKGVKALVSSPSARNLRSLDLSGSGCGVEGIPAIAESPYMANLRELRIYNNYIDLKGARALAASPYLSGLTHLSVGSVTATAKKVLRERFGAAMSF
jgi:uncharacterized protein (TIGR02996 family)